MGRVAVLMFEMVFFRVIDKLTFVSPCLRTLHEPVCLGISVRALRA